VNGVDQTLAILAAAIAGITGIVSSMVTVSLTRRFARKDKAADHQQTALRDLQDAIESLMVSVMDVRAHNSARAIVPAGVPAPPIDPLIYRDWVIAHARTLSLAERITDSQTRMLVLRFDVAAVGMVKPDLSVEEAEQAQAALIETHIAANKRLGQLIRKEIPNLPGPVAVQKATIEGVG
jgi:hypothetical protein